MKTRLVQIGNSRGVRLAKPIIEEAGLTDEVEIRVQAGAVVITAVAAARRGWAEAVATYGPPPPFDPPTSTRLDHEEWSWPE